MNNDPGRTVCPRHPSSGKSRRQHRRARPTRSLGSITSSPPLTRPTAPMPFRVELDIYRGPLDLLLYLVRKQELDIRNIPIAPITEQYLEYLAVLQELDVNAVGDFLEVAGLLIEIKSRVVLPRFEEESDEDPLDDPRELLVQQLLEYKQYKDAASMLEERGRSWSMCYVRQSNELPAREIDPADQPIHEVELWDLVSALGRIMRASESSQPTNIVYDETPIHVYMQTIHQRLREDGQVAFSDMFQPGMHKSAMIGIFLAVLELVRHHCVRAEQNELHAEIYLLPGEDFREELNLTEVDPYVRTPPAVAGHPRRQQASLSRGGPSPQESCRTRWFPTPLFTRQPIVARIADRRRPRARGPVDHNDPAESWRR